MAAILAALELDHKSKPDVSAKLEKSLLKLEEKRARLIDSWVEGHLSKPQYLDRLHNIDREKADLQAQLPAQSPAFDLKPLVAGIANTFAEFPYLPLDEKRTLLKRAVKDVRVAGGAVLGLTISGAFTGEIIGAKLSPHSRWRYSRRYQVRASRRPRWQSQDRHGVRETHSADR